MSLEHSPLCFLNFSTVPHLSCLCFLTYTLNRIRQQINRLCITYKLNVLLRLNHPQRISSSTRRFSSSSNLIGTYHNHLIRFLNYRCTNSGLIIRKHSILGILGKHVPIHPEHVPVHVCFWWGVPVHPCTCTGTPCVMLGCTGTPLYVYRYTLRNFAQICFYCHFFYQFTSYNFYNP